MHHSWLLSMATDTLLRRRSALTPDLARTPLPLRVSHPRLTTGSMTMTFMAMSMFDKRKYGNGYVQVHGI